MCCCPLLLSSWFLRRESRPSSMAIATNHPWDGQRHVRVHTCALHWLLAVRPTGRQPARPGVCRLPTNGSLGWGMETSSLHWLLAVRPTGRQPACPGVVGCLPTARWDGGGRPPLSSLHWLRPSSNATKFEILSDGISKTTYSRKNKILS